MKNKNFFFSNNLYNNLSILVIFISKNTSKYILNYKLISVIYKFSYTDMQLQFHILHLLSYSNIFSTPLLLQNISDLRKKSYNFCKRYFRIMEWNLLLI